MATPAIDFKVGLAHCRLCTYVCNTEILYTVDVFWAFFFGRGGGLLS